MRDYGAYHMKNEVSDHYSGICPAQYPFRLNLSTLKDLLSIKSCVIIIMSQACTFINVYMMDLTVPKLIIES